MSTTDDSSNTPFGARPESRGQDEWARDEARQAVDAAVLRIARAADAEIREHPAWPGSVLTIHDTDPAAGIWFAVILQGYARQKIHSYIRQARQNGLGWAQVGQALRLAPAADERGASLAEAAFEYATDAEHARPFDTLSFGWTCPACGGFVTDYGPAGGHPDDCEQGHAEHCQRQAAAIAAYEAQWADED